MSLTELTGNPRHDRLLMLIDERGYMNIDELASLLEVSTQTVRRDIRKLSEQGLITRHHGGAGRASSYIPDGSTIFITIGTTVEQVARALLNHNHLRIITNSLRVAHILYNNPRFEVMVPGGTLRPHNSGIIGPSAAAFVAGFRADYLVTSVGAIESDGALLEFDVNEASVVKTMMAHSRHILLAADHTKYHASAAVEIGNVSQITALFTDEYPGPALQNLLQSQQIEVVQVSPSLDDAVSA